MLIIERGECRVPKRIRAVDRPVTIGVYVFAKHVSIALSGFNLTCHDMTITHDGH